MLFFTSVLLYKSCSLEENLEFPDVVVMCVHFSTVRSHFFVLLVKFSFIIQCSGQMNMRSSRHRDMSLPCFRLIKIHDCLGKAWSTADMQRSRNWQLSSSFEPASIILNSYQPFRLFQNCLELTYRFIFDNCSELYERNSAKEDDKDYCVRSPSHLDFWPQLITLMVSVIEEDIKHYTPVLSQ
jgi:hypothetical protein